MSAALVITKHDLADWFIYAVSMGVASVFLVGLLGAFAFAFADSHDGFAELLAVLRFPVGLIVGGYLGWTFASWLVSP